MAGVGSVVVTFIDATATCVPTYKNPRNPLIYGGFRDFFAKLLRPLSLKAAKIFLLLPVLLLPLRRKILGWTVPAA